MGKKKQVSGKITKEKDKWNADRKFKKKRAFGCD